MRFVGGAKAGGALGSSTASLGRDMAVVVGDERGTGEYGLGWTLEVGSWKMLDHELLVSRLELDRVRAFVARNVSEVYSMVLE